MLFEEYLPCIKDRSKFKEYEEFLILHRKTKKDPSLYYENHHIVPACYLPKELHKDKRNIVLLEGYDHFKAHSLLHEAIGDSKTAYAVWLMMHARDGQGNIELLDKDKYDYYKKLHAENAAIVCRKTMKGRPSSNKGKRLSETHRNNISEAQKGKKLTAQHIENLRKSHIGYIMPQEQKNKIGLSNSGKVKDTVWRENLSKSNKGKSHGIKGGIHIYKEEGNIIKRTIINKDDLDKYLLEGWIKGRKIQSVFKPNETGLTKGTKWINNGQINKRVKEAELDAYITNGWIKGRI